MRKKIWSFSLVMALLLMLLSGCGGGESTTSSGNQSGGSDGGDNNEVYTVKISYENQPGEPVDLAAQKWKELAEQKSNGRLKLELFPSSQLGNKLDVIEQGMAGANVIQIGDASFLQNYVPDIGILSGPYLVESYDDLFKLIETDWFKDLEKQLNEKGLHIVSTNWIYGDRHIIASKPITKPEDLKGLKIRVPNNKLAIETLNAMGAVATPMPLGDVYPSVLQGVIDGMENPLPVIYGSKVQEKLKYISKTAHMKMVTQWIAGQKFIESLPEDIRQILKETADEAGEYNNQIVEESAQKTIADLEKEGVQFVEVDMNAFKESVKDVYNQFPEWTPGLYDKIQELIKN